MSYGVFAEFYDGLTQNVAYAEMADWIRRRLHEQGVTEGLLLDAACGTGSLAVRLCAAGYTLIGTDASPDMLCLAQEKAAAAGQDILFLCQPLERLDLFGTVDAAVCTLDSLNHLPSAAAVSAALSRIALFLNPNGICIFDVNTLYKQRVLLGQNTFVYDTDAVYCVWQNDASGSGETVDVSLDFFIPAADGQDAYVRESECFTERAYSDAAMRAMLAQAGFSVLAVYDGYSDLPLHAQSERAVYVVRKDLK